MGGGGNGVEVGWGQFMDFRACQDPKHVNALSNGGQEVVVEVGATYGLQDPKHMSNVVVEMGWGQPIDFRACQDPKHMNTLSASHTEWE